MEKTGEKPNRFGLVGRNISYSFSRGYFTRKFGDMGLRGYSYENFDLPLLDDFPRVLKENPDLRGLNVTIPYKEAIIPYLDSVSPEAAQIGAINTIKITEGQLTGFNTDIYGFREAIAPFMRRGHTKALILGTGGASKAVKYVLEHMGLVVTLVSRNPGQGMLAYADIGEKVLREHPVLINATPLGTHPNITDKPPLPYAFIGNHHLLFDLIYNPEKTAFLLEGESRGAQISNGLRMLELQAEKAWEIWNQGTTPG